MISLATFSTSTRVSPEGGETSLLSSAKGSFSALLARIGPEQAAETGEIPPAEDADVPENAPALAVVLSGIAVPAAAKGGKELPVILPGKGGEGEAKAAIETEAETETETGIVAVSTAEAVAAAIIAPQAPLPLLPVSGKPVETSNTAPARQMTPQPVPTAQIPVRADGETQAPASERANGAPRETAVALHVGPAATPAANNAAAGGDARDGASAQQRESTPLNTAVRFSQPEALRLSEQAMPAAPLQTAAINTVPASEAAAQAPRIETLQELTRVVDRLAAAREVFAPAAEALAIEHAEFGELSLRFDQRRDGGLSVQLSASNPEAQRAVAQAVSAQSFNSAADDRAGAGQTQNQPQGSASRGSAEREGTSGNGNAARHDQSAPQQQRQSARQQPGGGKPRPGVFA